MSDFLLAASGVRVFQGRLFTCFSVGSYLGETMPSQAKGLWIGRISPRTVFRQEDRRTGITEFTGAVSESSGSNKSIHCDSEQFIHTLCSVINSSGFGMSQCKSNARMREAMGLSGSTNSGLGVLRAETM